MFGVDKMIHVFGIDKDGYPRDIGIKEGTIESVKKQLEEIEFNIILIEEIKD